MQQIRIPADYTLAKKIRSDFVDQVHSLAKDFKAELKLMKDKVKAKKIAESVITIANQIITEFKTENQSQQPILKTQATAPLKSQQTTGQQDLSILTQGTAQESQAVYDSPEGKGQQPVMKPEGNNTQTTVQLPEVPQLLTNEKPLISVEAKGQQLDCVLGYRDLKRQHA